MSVNYDGNVFHPVILEDKIRIPCTHLSRDLIAYVTRMLRTKYCGVCSKFGYVKEDLLQVLKVFDPVMQLSHLNGDACCKVRFKVLLCNPEINSIVRGVVTNMNKFGVMARSGPIEAIITKTPVSTDLRSTVQFDDIQIGNIVPIQIMGKRFEIGDVTISVIGKIVDMEEKNYVSMSTGFRKSSTPVQEKRKRTEETAETKTVIISATDAMSNVATDTMIKPQTVQVIRDGVDLNNDDIASSLPNAIDSTESVAERVGNETDDETENDDVVADNEVVADDDEDEDDNDGDGNDEDDNEDENNENEEDENENENEIEDNDVDGDDNDDEDDDESDDIPEVDGDDEDIDEEADEIVGGDDEDDED